MGEKIKITSIDGHIFDTYLAQPKGVAKGGIVLVQEIFGVNEHIRRVADKYAREGYLVGVPALFDRFGPGIELGYGPEGREKGKELREKIGNELPLTDISAVLNLVSSSGKVGLVGYCWGGTLSWLAVCKIKGFSCASSYYGGGIAALADLKPQCPVIFHFGEQDHFITLQEVEILKNNQPDCPVYLYPAGHGFNCEQRNSFEETSSQIAEERTLKHFSEHMK
ncbi:MAG: carboxymethylenebutenolidase [Rhodospirillaceae bacterium]|nr:carboxymethylenebutenolidase [Rhodospirillaceae bacterium]|tara:strand:+ start:2172 stop:2840 length:669 start_codon:yes stop_codon:yes gene_type:complete